MSNDGMSSPPPDDFGEAPKVSFADRAASTAGSLPPTRPPALRKAPPKRKPAAPVKKKAPKKAGKKRPAPKKRPVAKKRAAPKKRAGKKKAGTRGGKKKR